MIENVFKTQDNIISSIIKHYKNSAISQFYKIIGSTDILGNPVGLLDKLGTGFAEMIAEPSKGLV